MECRKNYRRSDLTRFGKFIASSLSAVFSAGVFSGYVEAAELATKTKLPIVEIRKVIPELKHWIVPHLVMMHGVNIVNDLKKISIRLYNSKCFPSILKELEMEEEKFCKTFGLKNEDLKKIILEHRGVLLDYYVYYVLYDKCCYKILEDGRKGEKLKKCNYDNIESFLTLENFKSEIVNGIEQDF